MEYLTRQMCWMQIGAVGNILDDSKWSARDEKPRNTGGTFHGSLRTQQSDDDKHIMFEWDSKFLKMCFIWAFNPRAPSHCSPQLSRHLSKCTICTSEPWKGAQHRWFCQTCDDGVRWLILKKGTWKKFLMQAAWYKWWYIKSVSRWEYAVCILAVVSHRR